MHTCQLQDTKAYFSEVVKFSGTDQSFLQFMRTSPLFDKEELIIERDVSVTREIEL